MAKVRRQTDKRIHTIPPFYSGVSSGIACQKTTVAKILEVLNSGLISYLETYPVFGFFYSPKISSDFSFACFSILGVMYFLREEIARAITPRSSA